MLKVPCIFMVSLVFLVSWQRILTSSLNAWTCIPLSKWIMSKLFILLSQWASWLQLEVLNPTCHTYNQGCNLFAKWHGNHQIIHIYIHNYHTYGIFINIPNSTWILYAFYIGYGSLKATLPRHRGLRPEAAPEEIFTRDTITKRMPKILVPWKFMGRTCGKWLRGNLWLIQGLLTF